MSTPTARRRANATYEARRRSAGFIKKTVWIPKGRSADLNSVTTAWCQEYESKHPTEPSNDIT